MKSSINTTAKKHNHHANNRHRKKEPGSTRGSLRPEIPISGKQTGISGNQSHRTVRTDRTSSGHGPNHVGKTQRSVAQLGRRSNNDSAGCNSMVTGNLRAGVIESAERLFAKIAREKLLTDNVILRTTQGFFAFGKYTVTETAVNFQIYRGATLAATMSNSRTALSWCIADKLKKYSLAQEISTFDTEVNWRNNEIVCYSRVMYNSTDMVRRSIARDRISESRARLKYAKYHLDKCINLAKYWQQKGFNDETARFRINDQSTNS